VLLFADINRPPRRHGTNLVDKLQFPNYRESDRISLKRIPHSAHNETGFWRPRMSSGSPKRGWQEPRKEKLTAAQEAFESSILPSMGEKFSATYVLRSPNDPELRAAYDRACRHKDLVSKGK
jgi:hypothetical protein